MVRWLVIARMEAARPAVAQLEIAPPDSVRIASPGLAQPVVVDVFTASLANTTASILQIMDMLRRRNIRSIDAVLNIPITFLRNGTVQVLTTASHPLRWFTSQRTRLSLATTISTYRSGSQCQIVCHPGRSRHNGTPHPQRFPLPAIATASFLASWGHMPATRVGTEVTTLVRMCQPVA